MAHARSAAGKPEVLYEDVCYDAQQAVEKALKGVLIWKGETYPKTHAIQELVTLLIDAGIETPAEIRASSELTEFAVETRYPGFYEDVSQEDYEKAIMLAEHVVAWAADLIEKV